MISTSVSKSNSRALEDHRFWVAGTLASGWSRHDSARRFPSAVTDIDVDVVLVARDWCAVTPESSTSGVPWLLYRNVELIAEDW